MAMLVFTTIFAQDTTANFSVSAGLRCKKYVGFYWVNGVSGEFSSPKILDHKIQFGMNLASSVLGTALTKNAVPTLEAELSVIKHFRHNKSFQPLIRLNVGYAHANYKSDEFNDLPQNGVLLSFETGVSYGIRIAEEKFSLKATGGYNLFSGNGMSGLSTIYPVYGQFSILYSIK